MNTSSDIWFAFARTFAMLFLVLALLILAFYLIKRFSESRGRKGNKEYIKVLSVHYLSPKEKLVLLDVLGETLLVGVTPSQISKISSLDVDMDLSSDAQEQKFGFSDFLSKKMGSSLIKKQDIQTPRHVNKDEK